MSKHSPRYPCRTCGQTFFQQASRHIHELTCQPAWKTWSQDKAESYIEAVQEEDYADPCVHGHPECALKTGGPCVKEVAEAIG